MRGASVAAVDRMAFFRARGKRLAPIGERAFLLLTLLGATPAAAQQIAVVSPLQKIFPYEVVNGEGAARLEAAGGEWEPFQIAVTAGAQPLRAVRAEAVGLWRPRLYRVELVDVQEPSSVEGGKGRWPDPLVPDVDGYAGEKRAAFPFDVPAGETRAIWVELFVPSDAKPGVHRGKILLRGGVTAEVPVELTVHRFKLPKTSSIPVTFGISGNALPKAHHRPDSDMARLLQRYAVAALRHRISLHGGTMEPAAWIDGRVDFRAYDAEVGPFLDGKADPGGPAEGARWSAIDLRIPHKLAPEARAEYVRQLVAHFRARGWLSRLFDYTWDEPADKHLSELRAKADWLHRVAPEIPRLVTKERTAKLAGAVDIWCPTVNYLEDRPENSSPPPRKSYGREKIWWYQACMSHGCDIVGGDYFRGWPSLAIDAPAISHRMMEWLTHVHDVGGELYYNTVEAYLSGMDPWQGSRLHGGNGDGTLFYPGRPDKIGGQTDIPVESVRLKLIREGLEDYEYLHAYELRFGRAAAERMSRKLARRTYDWEHDPKKLYQVRHEIAEALDGKLAGP
jgi:hypothetical protein